MGAYDKSGMEKVKWHMLDHVSEDTVSNGGLYMCDAGLTDIRIQSLINRSPKSQNEEHLTWINLFR